VATRIPTTSQDCSVSLFIWQLCFWKQSSTFIHLYSSWY